MSARADIRVGPAGWSYADWEGRVYPKRKPRGFHPLEHLARFVDCVEINSTFYALPRADYAERWVECVAERPRFRFTAKLPGRVTHEPLPTDDRVLESEARAYFDGLGPLVDAGLLAALLVQFPVSLRAGTPEADARLGVARALFGSIPLVVEVRHASFFTPDALAGLASEGFSVAAIDLPPANDHPKLWLDADDAPRLPGPIGYLRLHGRNAKHWFRAQAGRDDRYDYLYDFEEVERAVSAAERVAKDRDATFVVTNNHFEGKAVANALEILAGLSDTVPFAPPELIEAYPRLRGRTRAIGQDTLF